jgi:hypothetical protein
MAFAHDFPAEPRLQQISIGTAIVAFSSGGPDWEDFVRDREGLAKVDFVAAPDEVAEEFVQALSNRVAMVARRTLAEVRPVYQVVDYEGRRGSILITLEIGLTPADVTIILGVPAAALYKTVKDYKTLRESAIAIYSDLSSGLTAIGNRLSALFHSFERMDFERKLGNLLRAIGIAAQKETEDPTKFDKEAHEKEMEEEGRELEERIKKAEAEGRLGGGEITLIKKK